jgi:Protein of unknown function (DUF1559)
MSRQTGCGRYLTGAVVLVTLLTVIALCLPDVAHVREPARLSDAQNRLRQVMLALHDYEDAYEKLPNAATVGEKGRPLHSWRTAILPFIDGSNIHRQIDFATAWNDQVNVDLKAMRFDYYESPFRGRRNEPGLTHFVAVVGPDTVIREHGNVTIKGIQDDTSTTGVLLEFVDSDIYWAETRDVTVEDAIQIIQEFDGFRGVAVVMSNGSVDSISPGATAEDIRKLFNCSDGPPSAECFRQKPDSPF